MARPVAATIPSSRCWSGTGSAGTTAAWHEETVELVRMALAQVGRQAELRVTSYRELFFDALALDPHQASLEQLQAPLAEVRIDGEGLNRDDWLDLLMTHRLQPAFPRDRITVVHDWPASQCALARIRPGMPPVAERFELYLGATNWPTAITN